MTDRLVDDIDFDHLVEPDYWQFKVWVSADGRRQPLYAMNIIHLKHAEAKCRRELIKATRAVEDNPSLEWSLVTQAYIAARKGWIHAITRELSFRNAL